MKYNSIFLWLAVIALISIFLLMIPLFGNYKISDYSEENPSPIFFSLKSNEFKYSLIVSLSISIPLVIELFIRALFVKKSLHLLYLVMAPNSITLLLLAVPDLIILFYVLEFSDLYVLNYVLKMRLILLLWASFAQIHLYGGNRWSYYGTLMSVTFANISRVLVFYTDFKAGFMQSYIMVFIASVFNILALITFLMMAYRWFNYVYQETRTKPLTKDQYLCNIYTTASLICWVGLTIIYFSCPTATNWLEYDPIALTCHTLIFTVFYIFIIIFENKAMQRELVRTKASLIQNDRFHTHWNCIVCVGGTRGEIYFYPLHLS